MTSKPDFEDEFEEEDREEKILRIGISYHRVAEFMDYSESLVMDRKSETLENVQMADGECLVERKYHVQDGISEFLDALDAESLFAKRAEKPSDAGEDPEKERSYTITVSYEKKPNKVISGTFDQDGLPEDFPSFIDAVWDFMGYYGYGEIFDTSLYVGNPGKESSEEKMEL